MSFITKNAKNAKKINNGIWKGMQVPGKTDLISEDGSVAENVDINVYAEILRPHLEVGDIVEIVAKKTMFQVVHIDLEEDLYELYSTKSNQLLWIRDHS